MHLETISYHRVSRLLILVDVLVAIFYFSWWVTPAHISNLWLYTLLFIGEIYHVIMALTFWFTVWPANKITVIVIDKIYQPSVAVFITVAGEPVEVVEKTAQAAKEMDYRNKEIYILNDGYVAKKDNWQQIEAMAKKLGIHCITRKVAGGAKAGNINNALRETKSDLVAIFDADMVPEPEFLVRTVPFFKDQMMGFVQTPQFYVNSGENLVTAAAWDQQKLFFGPIMRGKEKSNASFICGTNVVIRRKALEKVGGMEERNIAEDFLTSLYIHQAGWRSRYLPEVLAKGLAPQDLLSYHKQQFRWARGSLEVLFNQNPFFKKGLTLGQKVQYLASALYYFNGFVILIDLLMPLLYLFFAVQPVGVSTTSFAVYFLPFIFINLYTLNLAAGADISFKTFSFSYSSWYLQLMAIFSVLMRRTVSFSVTPKQAQSGNYLKLSFPHIIYIILVAAGSVLAIHREEINPSVATNMAWALFNVAMFMPYVLVAANLLPFHKANKMAVATQANV
ncbi:glycosyltransferase [Patescibacteria group bacterium]|nr:glycosyltransferase [Patescibacteria group bacterium]